MLRKLIGFIRLYVIGICPNCCSEPEWECPVCQYTYIKHWPRAKRAVWERFKSKA